MRLGYPLKGRLSNRVAKRLHIFFQGSFEQGGFTNRTFKKWAKKRNGEDSYLQKTGRLKAQTRVLKVGNGYVSYGNTTTPYAHQHNEGVEQKKRTFIDHSETLNREIAEDIQDELGEILNEIDLISF